MRLIRVGAGVVNQTALDWSGNQERLLAAIEEAREAGVQVFCLPELSITGYGCEDAFFSPDVARRAMAMLPVLAEASQGMLTAVGLPLLYQGSLYNVAALLGDGEVHGMVAKQTLAGDGIHYEPRWFKPWPSGVVRAVEVGDELINFGDLLFEVDVCALDSRFVRTPGSRNVQVRVWPNVVSTSFLILVPATLRSRSNRSVNALSWRVLGPFTRLMYIRIC